ncbi:MAG: Ig-like domain repeat protein, partial [Treponema sp.]|nr:Ig-like domain repeat protein [Treponema sp.]
MKQSVLLRAVLILLAAVSVLEPAVVFAGGQGESARDQANGTLNWSKTFDISDKKPGVYNLYAEAQDLAGNKTIAGPINLYVDPKSDLPIARIANPLQGMRVSGDLNIVGTCTDDDGVERVELQIDGGDWIVAKGTAFWSYYVKTGDIPDGRRKISVRGVDINGLVGPIQTIQFDMDRSRPGATILNPQAGALVSGRIDLKGTVQDANGVAKVDFSLDNGKTWTQIKGSYDAKKGVFPFSASVDTKTLNPGPTVVLIRGTDGVGSVGITPTLFVVDNTKPEISIMSPLPGEKIDRTFVVMGRVRDDVALKSFSWKMGNEGGEFPLTPGDPYWALPVKIADPKAAAVEILFTARDLIGNTTEYRFKFPLDSNKDLPRTTLLAPLALGPNKPAISTGSLFVSGFARDDDGIAAIEYWIDKDTPKKIDTTGAFSVRIDGITPGKHTVSVRAIDRNGTAGPVAATLFEDMGPPPELSIDSLVFNSGTKEERSETFTAGSEVAPDAKGSLRLVAKTLGKLEKLTYSFADGSEQTIAAKGSGSQNFLVPLPAAGPFGFVAFKAQVADSAGRTASVASHVYITNYGTVRGDLALVFADERISGDNIVYFRKDAADKEPAPFVGRFVGADIALVSLEPESKIVQLSTEAGRIIVRPVSFGVSGPHRIVVKSTLGHIYKSDPFTFNNDNAGPQIQIKKGETPFVSGPSYMLSATLTDLSAIHSASYRILTAEGQEIANGPIPINGKAGDTKATTVTINQEIKTQVLPEGPFIIEMQALDTAGNKSTELIPLFKDTLGPEIYLATPSSSIPMPYAAGFVQDPSGLQSLSYAADGKNFTPLDASKPFVIPLLDPVSGQLLSGSGGAIKAVDRAGRERLIQIPAYSPSSDVLNAPSPSENTGAQGKQPAPPSPKIEYLGILPGFNQPVISGTPAAVAPVGSKAIVLIKLSGTPPLAPLNYAVGNAKGIIQPEALIPLGQGSADGQTLYAGAFMVDLGMAKAGPMSANLSVKDKTGKTASSTISLQYNADFERPAVPYVSLEDNSLQTPLVRFLVSSQSSTGIQGYRIQLDKDSPQLIESPTAAVVELPNLAAGSHVLIITAVDLGGRESSSIKRSFKVVGPVPQMGEVAVVQKAGRTVLERAGTFSYEPGALLEGLVQASNGLSSVELRFGDKAPIKGTIKKGTGADTIWQVPIPQDLPYARIPINIIFTDGAGLSVVKQFDLYRIMPVEDPTKFDKPGLYINDLRYVSKENSFRFTSDNPLIFRFIGQPLQSVRFDTDAPELSVNYQDKVVSVRPVKEGKTKPLTVIAKTVEGDEFRWGPCTFIIDLNEPNLTLIEPQQDGWYKGLVPFQADLDPVQTGLLKIQTFEYAIDSFGDEEPQWTPLSVTADAKNPLRVRGEFLITGSDGAHSIRFRVTNGLGRSREYQMTLNRDTQNPMGRIILPPNQDPVNGRITISAQFNDEGGQLANLSYSEDGGKTWQPSESADFISRRFDLSAQSSTADLIRFKAIDVAGNVTELVGAFNLDVVADKPRVQIMQPEEMEVLREDFVIAGAAFDDDGLKSIHYRF